jgi:hypothetical protein
MGKERRQKKKSGWESVCSFVFARRGRILPRGLGFCDLFAAGGRHEIILNISLESVAESGGHMHSVAHTYNSEWIAFHSGVVNTSFSLPIPWPCHVTRTFACLGVLANADCDACYCL